MADQEGATATEVTRTDPFPDADIKIGNFVISGVRTFSIIFLIVLTYCYLVVTQPTVAGVDGMRELVLMAVGFLFGAKVMKR